VNSRPEFRRERRSSSRNPSPGGTFRPLETVALVHVGVLLLFASWAFGGGADWARFLISAWSSLGLFITAAGVRSRATRGESLRHPLLWLCPFVGFNILVLLSCLNPSFSARVFAGQALLAHTGAAFSWLPSTAHPPTSLEHLWLFDAIYLSCFNLALAIRRRQALRVLLLVAVANAVLLSVFGTFQKLTSDGLFFGSVAAPNPRFFATFVYGNHWAAYILLLVAACLGLLFYYGRRVDEEQYAASPLTTGIMGLLLMAITPLLAGSRAGTLLVLVLLAAGFVHLLRYFRRRRTPGGSAALPVTGLVVGVALALGGAVYIGRGAVQERWLDTQGQLRTGLLDERLKLYADTWHLAAEQPVFGWGFGSFDKVLQLIRPRPLEANRQYEHSYVDAHSDWLQSLAEVGFTGTALLILLVLWPLLSSQALRFAGALPAYLLGGCGLILLYAGVEFPFGNPAVMVAFWICFFSAIQYVRLGDRSRATH
jgi:O-antigen ligase